MIDYETAIDLMYGVFNTKWQDSAAIVGYVPDIRWEGVEETNSPALDQFYCRVTQKTASEPLVSLRSDSSNRRYRSKGFIFIQIFCPRAVGTAFQSGRKLATLTRECFLTSRMDDVLIREVVRKELDPEPSWYRFNVNVQYEFDEFI